MTVGNLGHGMPRHAMPPTFPGVKIAAGQTIGSTFPGERMVVALRF